MDEIVWLHWEDSDGGKKKKQARESYITIRELEEEIGTQYGKQTRERYCLNKRFQRMPDGYIYVDGRAGPQKELNMVIRKKGSAFLLTAKSSKSAAVYLPMMKASTWAHMAP